MRDLLFLAEGPLLTPSRSQMIVFAAWVQTLPLQILLLELCNLSTRSLTKVHLGLHNSDILAGNIVFSPHVIAIVSYLFRQKVSCGDFLQTKFTVLLSILHCVCILELQQTY